MRARVSSCSVCGRGDAVHDRVEHPCYVLAGLGGDLDDLLLFHAEQFHEFLRDGRNIGYGEVYLVEHGDDLEVVLHRQVEVRERLGLYALARVYDEERAFTGRYGPRDLVGEVDVAGRVDQVQVVLAVFPVVEDTHGLGLDRDATFALQVHGVEDLVHPLALGDGLRYVE